MKTITIQIPDDVYEWLTVKAKQDYRSVEDLAAVIVQKERVRRAAAIRTQKAFYERKKARAAQ